MIAMFVCGKLETNRIDDLSVPSAMLETHSPRPSLRSIRPPVKLFFKKQSSWC